MRDIQFITSQHPSYIENIYNDFVKDPSSIDPDLKKFFEGFDFAVSTGKQSTQNGVANASVSSGQLSKEFAVYQLIQAYRQKGHLVAKTNPIRPRRDLHANLELSHFGLSDSDLSTAFEAGSFIGLGKSTLSNIIAQLQKCYAGPVGVEFSGITDPVKLEWLTKEVESTLSGGIALEQKRRILEKLNQGVMFEKFLHTKYIGQKRFSLEGGETTIPALDAIINVASQAGVKEAVIGMAHRGRLNVLANILGKTYEEIFNEFEGNSIPDTTMGSGDVKYHLGFSSDVQKIGRAHV